MDSGETDGISTLEASRKGTIAENDETHSVTVAVEPSRAELDPKSAPRELDSDTPSSSVFTTEIYKVRIGNLPPYFGFRQLRALLTKRLNLNVAKLKAQPGANWAYATFHSQEETETALKAIDGFEWKKRILTAKGAKAMEQPVMKAIAENLMSSPPAKKMKLEKSLVEMLNDQVTPIWKMPYDEQLRVKWQEHAQVLKRLGSELEKMKAGDWVASQRRDNDGRCCPLESVRPSPILSHYRNKCEFNAGPGPDGQPTIGFRLGKYKDGYNLVVEPASCVHTPPVANSIAGTFQQYIQQSEYEPYSTLDHSGYWKMLTVRITSAGDVMAIVHFHPQHLTAIQVKEEMSKVKNFIQERHPTITSLMSQCDMSVNVGVSESSYELLLGSPYVKESLLGQTFQISPDAFFQVNTPAAEVLYTLIREWAAVEYDTHLLDICCGTGTIGLSMAGSVHKVTGIEMAVQAVKDAQVNAQLNGISNARFVCGKAEDVLPGIVTECHGERRHVVGVVDPPRAGLHMKVMHTIRRCQQLKTLVFVSCNPSGAYRNMIDLCRPSSGKVKGMPFQLMKAAPVDLFPMTKHCELILLFQR